MKALSVKLKSYVLNEIQLGNLASEFFGSVLSCVGGEDTIDIEFDTVENRKQFEIALNNFKKKLDL